MIQSRFLAACLGIAFGLIAASCASKKQNAVTVADYAQPADEIVTFLIANIDESTLSDDLVKLESEVRRVRGVTFASADRGSRALEVRHEPGARRESIEQAIERAGFWLSDQDAPEEPSHLSWDAAYDESAEAPEVEPAPEESSSYDEYGNDDEQPAAEEAPEDRPAHEDYSPNDDQPAAEEAPAEDSTTYDVE